MVSFPSFPIVDSITEFPGDCNPGSGRNHEIHKNVIDVNFTDDSVSFSSLWICFISSQSYSISLLWSGKKSKHLSSYSLL